MKRIELGDYGTGELTLERVKGLLLIAYAQFVADANNEVLKGLDREEVTHALIECSERLDKHPKKTELGTLAGLCFACGQRLMGPKIDLIGDLHYLDALGDVKNCEWPWAEWQITKDNQIRFN